MKLSDVEVNAFAREDGSATVVVEIDTADSPELENERGPFGLVVYVNDGTVYDNTESSETGERSELISVEHNGITGAWTVYARADSSQDWTRLESDEASLADLLALAHDVATGG